jgi:hypothetical protein
VLGFFSYWSELKVSLKGPFDLRVFFLSEGKRLFSPSKEFEEFVLKNRGNQIKKDFEWFLIKKNIRKDLYIIEYPMTSCISCGYNKFPFATRFGSDAAIFLTKGFSEVDPEACSFILKHELSHTKSRDVFWGSFFSFLSAISFFAGLYFLMSWFYALCAVFFIFPYIGKAIYSLWMRFRERRADAFAVRNSSLEELQGGIRYFSAVKKFNSTFPQFDSEGESLRKFDHPTLRSRIKNLQKEIVLRGFEFYLVEEDKVEALVQMLKSADQKNQEIINGAAL